MKDKGKHATRRLPSLKEALTIVLQNQAGFMAWMEQGLKHPEKLPPLEVEKLRREYEIQQGVQEVIRKLLNLIGE